MLNYYCCYNYKLIEISDFFSCGLYGFETSSHSHLLPVMIRNSYNYIKEKITIREEENNDY